MTNIDQLKKQAAHRAVDYLKSGMVVGLGTGSTTKFALEKIAAHLQSGDLQNIIGIPSSIQTEKLAKKLSIPLTTFDVHPQIDITIDGADEVDANMNLIKGGGGALLREKVLAQASHENIIIVDEGKISGKLGEKWAIPIEIIPFAENTERRFLEKLGASVQLRKNAAGKIFYTDQQNIILDANFGVIENPATLATQLNERAGIVEHGLFLNLATRIIIAGKAGVREIHRDLNAER